jgi:acetoacetyl-CoA synthetase
VKNLGYFKRYPGVWSQGDWLTISTNGFCLISGRLDATLNRGGVRLGTGEFYPVVENVPGVVDSLVIHLEDSTGGSGELILFVQLEGDFVLDDALTKDINRVLAKELSPRHVPDHIYQVSGVPRSLNGKKLEVPVKRILRGAAISEVVDSSATSTFELLQEYERYKPVST